MTDSSTQEFQDLANLYLTAFVNTLARVDTGEVGTLTSISFATIRVMSFTLDSSFRKRREEGRDNLSQIMAEIETVYNVQGKGDYYDAGKTVRNTFIHYHLDFPPKMFLYKFQL